MVDTVKLAVIPGDGIGPEVVEQALKALAAATEGSGVAFEQTEFSLGAATVAEQLPAAIGEQLAASAALAFDEGVVITSLIGVGLMVAAAVVAVLALRNPKDAAAHD